MNPATQCGEPSTALPDALSELVQRVIRVTRLWPSEKRDIQHELESHFREGLQDLTAEGRSLEESIELLKDEFGDPELAAVLIRRGKKRGRPMFWKIFSGIITTAVISAGAGGGYMAYLSWGKPTPTVDYVEKINEPIRGTAESDRAWPLFREIILQMKDAPDLGTPKAMPMPGEALWPAAAQWVAANEALLPRITEAAHKPVYGFVYDNKATQEFMAQRLAARGEKSETAVVAEDPLIPPTIALLLPHLADMRDIGRILALHARQRLYQNDFNGAWTSLDTAHRIGAQLMGGQTLIEQLVGRVIIAMADESMRRALFDWRDRLTPDMLATVRASHVMTMPLDLIKPHFDGEQLFFYDVVQYLFTDDGAGNGRLIPTQLEKLLALGTTGESSNDANNFLIAARHADRRETVEKYEDMYRRMREVLARPLHDPTRESDYAALMSDFDNAELRKRFAVISYLLPSLIRADRKMKEGAMEALAMRTIVALAAYRLETGNYPARLSDLPATAGSPPIDAYSGVSLRYVSQSAGAPLLYSIGLNRRDDGGSSAVEPTEDTRNAESADIVYWPPAK